MSALGTKGPANMQSSQILEDYSKVSSETVPRKATAPIDIPNSVGDEYVLVKRSLQRAQSGPVYANDTKNTGNIKANFLSVPGGTSSTQYGSHGDQGDDIKAVKLPLMSHMSRLSGGNRKPIRVTLVEKQTVVGAAATALSTVGSCSPINGTDYGSFAAVYDLCRVHRIRVAWRVGSSIALAGSADAVLAWDPINPSAYTSVSDGLTAEHHLGPSALQSEVASFTTRGVSADGYRHMTIKLPAAKLTVDTTIAAVGGSWFGVSTSTIVVGYLKPYIESLGAGNIATQIVWVHYDCEFRSRT